MTSLTVPQTTACQFTDLKNGVWKFTFIQANNHAVDEWFQWQTYLREAFPPPDDMRASMLLDVRKSGPIPLLYALQQGRDWRKQHPEITSIRLHLALLLKPFNRLQQPYIKLIKDGVNVFLHEQVGIEVFFDEEQKAIDWLLNA